MYGRNSWQIKFEWRFKTQFAHNATIYIFFTYVKLPEHCLRFLANTGGVLCRTRFKVLSTRDDRPTQARLIRWRSKRHTAGLEASNSPPTDGVNHCPPY